MQTGGCWGIHMDTSPGGPSTQKKVLLLSSSPASITPFKVSRCSLRILRLTSTKIFFLGCRCYLPLTLGVQVPNYKASTHNHSDYS